jgi:hypothetical protein
MIQLLISSTLTALCNQDKQVRKSRMPGVHGAKTKSASRTVGEGLAESLGACGRRGLLLADQAEDFSPDPGRQGFPAFDHLGEVCWQGCGQLRINGLYTEKKIRARHKTYFPPFGVFFVCNCRLVCYKWP